MAKTEKKDKSKASRVFAIVLGVILAIITLGLVVVPGNVEDNYEKLRKDLAALEKKVEMNDALLDERIKDGDESLGDQIVAGDSALSNQITTGDNILSESIGELEDSIVWYQHDVRLTINVESTETGGSATAIGYCGLTIINDNPTAYDCIDVGNGNNALVSDLATTGSKNTSGYCLVDYSTYEGGYGRRLMYLLQNTTIFNDTTEGSVYDGNHLYVYVYSVYSEGDFATPNVQSQLIPNIVISYNPDGTPVYNGGRLILTDTVGIKTATISDTVTTISLK